jgi:hypothetical protein
MTTQSPTRKSPNPTTAEPAVAPLAEDLARLCELIANAPIREARAFAKELQQRWPESAEVAHWARVLAPPVARRVRPVGPRPKDRELEFGWLREHAGEYPGCWLAVLDDRLLAADPELRVVTEHVRSMPGADQALFHFQPLPQGTP